MKKLTILTILCVAILSLVGCSQSTFTPRQETAFELTNDIVEETIEIEEAIEETKTEEKEIEYGKVVYDTQDNKELKGVWKKMLVKIVKENKVEELTENYVIVDGVVYTNPENNPNLDFKALGYKHLFIDDFPSYDQDTQKVIVHYYDDGELIHRAWRVINLTKEEIEQREKMKKEFGE